MEGTLRMIDAQPATKEENERQYRVIDQMLTMHSLLRDRMERRAFWLNTALIASSLFLTVFTFVGDDLLRALNLDPALTRFVLGLVTVVVLICSITEFRVDWRSVAGRHAEAVSRLARMKTKYRQSFTDTGGNDPQTNAILTSACDNMMSNISTIPDRWFNVLKAEHQFKRLLSERISQCPKTPRWFLRLQLRIEGIKETL
ncbi:MAG TPA: hypothetical protein VJZ03_01400 [Candidatus Bathyarchaeia archaeon]|nr:hypothetical protein [Candidatus Bathyarchaeia archaeon]